MSLAEQYLPAIFRRPRYRTPGFNDIPEERDNLLGPRTVGPSTTQLRSDAPASTNVLSPQEPQVQPVQQPVQPQEQAQQPPNPLVADLKHLRDVEDQPAKKHFWRSMLLGALQGFAAGGIGGAIAGAPIGGALNIYGEGKKQKEIGKTKTRIAADQMAEEEMRKRQKADADLEKTAAETDLAVGRTREIARKASARPPRKLIERKDGVYAVDPETLKAEKVGEIPEEAKTGNANPTRYFEREDGVYGVNDQHPEGFKVPNVPGKQSDTGQAALTNAMIDKNIAEADAEQKKLGPAPEMYVDTVDPISGESKRTLNPAYTNWESRYQKLDDDKRRWREQKKAVRAPATAPRLTKPKSDPLGLFK